jgi:hypothetical protein
MDSAQTLLIAHELMLRMLVNSEKNRNPVFADEARKSVDDFLGHLARDPTNECFIEVRAQFMATLDTRTDILGSQQSEEPMSLRRRFLLWLLNG